jgi:hypothetical protein
MGEQEGQQYEAETKKVRQGEHLPYRLDTPILLFYKGLVLLERS